MTTAKVSVSLEEDLVLDIKKIVGDRGFSAFLNEAAKRQLQHLQIRQLLDEMDVEFGPIDSKIKQEVDKEWFAKPPRKSRARKAA